MLLVAAAAAVFVLAPLRRPSLRAERGPSDRGPSERESSASEMEGERLALERAGLAQALRDLELDRATGKLRDEDYAELAARYRARALAVLRRPDEGGGG